MTNNSQVFHTKVAGKVKFICGGHGPLYLQGEAYLDNLQEAAQQLVDQGEEVLVPSPRPAGVWKSVCGDRLTDLNWASINVNRDIFLTVPPDKIASLSNLQVKGGAVNEAFKPDTLNYTADVDADLQFIEIIPTATSRRYTLLSVNDSGLKSGQICKVALNDKNTAISIKVVSPDGTAKGVYSLLVTKGDSH